ncbi:MAG: hypothetical protein ACRDJ2_08135 [Actinomycetota bacterium]
MLIDLLKKVGILLLAAGLGFAAMSIVLAAPSEEPTKPEEDDVECGRGLVAQDSFWTIPSKDAFENPRDALAYYINHSPGMEEGDSEPMDEFVLHPDSRGPGEAEDQEHVRYIHPTNEGFDADVQVLTIDGRWYVEAARVCQDSFLEWNRRD